MQEEKIIDKILMIMHFSPVLNYIDEETYYLQMILFS